MQDKYTILFSLAPAGLSVVQAGTCCIAFNTASRFFSNPEYRRAFQTAVDRAYAVSLLGDCAVASALPVHPASPYFDETLVGGQGYDMSVTASALTDAKVLDMLDRISVLIFAISMACLFSTITSSKRSSSSGYFFTFSAIFSVSAFCSSVKSS